MLAFALLASALCAQAFFDSNINYDSPSRRHDPLGIHLHKVEKRFDDHKLVARGASPAVNFTSGVASGDPLPSSVILWTRLAPISNETVASPICVTYQVSSSQSMSDTIDKGTAYTSSDVDYTVKVEAKNLKSFSTYYYQFKSCDGTLSSPIGRTKTAPGPFDKLPSTGIRFAVYSCSNFRSLPWFLTDGSIWIFQCLRRTCSTRFRRLRIAHRRLHLRIRRMRMYPTPLSVS